MTADQIGEMRTLRNFATPMEYDSGYEGSLTGTSTQQPTLYASACRRLVGFDAESSSAYPTASQAHGRGIGPQQTDSHPWLRWSFCAWTERDRFAVRDATLSCVIPSFLAFRTCVSLRACRSSRKVISSALNAAVRVSTFFRWRGRNFLILSSTFVAMVTPSLLQSREMRVKTVIGLADQLAITPLVADA